MKNFKLKLVATSRDYIYENETGKKFMIEHHYEKPITKDTQITLHAVKVSRIMDKEHLSLGMFGFATKSTNETDIIKDLNEGLSKFFDELQNVKSRAIDEIGIDFDDLSRMFNDFMNKQ